jgi:hypothetical protein
VKVVLDCLLEGTQKLIVKSVGVTGDKVRVRI